MPLRNVDTEVQSSSGVLMGEDVLLLANVGRADECKRLARIHRPALSFPYQGRAKLHSAAKASAAVSGSSPGKRPACRRWAWANSCAMSHLTKHSERNRSVRLSTTDRPARLRPGAAIGTCITTPGPGS